MSSETLIAPGGEGKIKVRLSTTGYAGLEMKEKITVHTNDSENPVVDLWISGAVHPFAQLEPKMIRLKGKVGEPVTGEMRITPAGNQDFESLKAVARHGKHISFTLEKVKEGAGAHWVLRVENLRAKPGRYYDVITIQPDVTPQREIKVRVSGDLSS